MNWRPQTLDIQDNSFRPKNLISDFVPLDQGSRGLHMTDICACPESGTQSHILKRDEFFRAPSYGPLAFLP